MKTIKKRGKTLLILSLCLFLSGLVLGVAGLSFGAKTQLSVVLLQNNLEGIDH